MHGNALDLNGMYAFCFHYFFNITNSSILNLNGKYVNGNYVLWRNVMKYVIQKEKVIRYFPKRIKIINVMLMSCLSLLHHCLLKLSYIKNNGTKQSHI